MEVSLSVSVPQLLSPEKSSSNRLSVTIPGIVVSVGKGIFAVTVGGGIFAVTAAGGISVAPKGRLCQLEARKIAPPPTATNRQRPTRQPATQPAVLPDLGAAWETGGSLGGLETGTEIVFRARGPESFSFNARFHADKNSAAVANLSSGSFARALRMRSEEHTSELQSLAYLVC